MYELSTFCRSYFRRTAGKFRKPTKELKQMIENGEDVTGLIRPITDMSGLFKSNAAFNQDISLGCFKCCNMNLMFCGAAAFNQDISNWNTQTSPTWRMFWNASAFDQHISAGIPQT